MKEEKRLEAIAKEQPIFVSKVKIVDGFKGANIPEGVDLVRTIKNHYQFYKGIEPKGSKNGWTQIPQSALKVYLYNYRPASGNYGTPTFKYEKNKVIDSS